MNLDLIWEGAQHVCRMQIPKNETKTTPHVRVRWLMMHVARKRGYSLVTIAQFFGMHHTSVMHALNKFEKLGAVRELPELERYLEKPPVIRSQRLEKPVREKLPEDRAGLTLHFVITTLQDDKIVDVDGYVQTGEYPSGKLGELFVKCGKQGDHHAVLDSWAISTSIALQYGAPVDELLSKFTNTNFEPSGAVTGVEGIKRCTSPLDLVSRWLLLKYGKREP